jgi:hypothetical protein
VALRGFSLRGIFFGRGRLRFFDDASSRASPSSLALAIKAREHLRQKNK